jgi:hypothetical protein
VTHGGGEWRRPFAIIGQGALRLNNN